MTELIVAPDIAGGRVRLDTIEKTLVDDAAAIGKTFGAPYAAVLIAMIAALANSAAKFDRALAADYLHAVWRMLAGTPESADLDGRRVNAAAAALFNAGWRRSK